MIWLVEPDIIKQNRSLGMGELYIRYIYMVPMNKKYNLDYQKFAVDLYHSIIESLMFSRFI